MSQLPRAQLDQSLAVPGLAVTPPVSAGASQAQELFRSIGMIGETVGRIGQIAEKKTAEVEAALRGQAALDVQKQIPEFEQKIVNGEMDHMFADLGEGETVHGRVEAFLNDRLGPDVPDAYREEVAKYAPMMTQALVNRHQKLIDDSKADVAELTLEGVLTARSAADFGDIASAYSNTTGKTPAASSRQVVYSATQILGQMPALNPATEAYLKTLENYAPNDPNTYIARQQFNERKDREENAARVEHNREFRGIIQEQINTGNIDVEGAEEQADRLKYLDAETRSAYIGTLKDAGNKRNREALLSRAENMAKIGAPVSVIHGDLAKFASDNGIPMREAERLVNNKILTDISTLSISPETEGDIADIVSLSEQLWRPTPEDTHDLGVYVDRAKRNYENHLELVRKEAFLAEKKNTYNQMVSGYFNAAMGGVPLDQLKPTDDVTVNIMGEDVTFKVGPMFDDIHQMMVAKGYIDAMEALPGDATEEDKAAAIYGSRIETIRKTGRPDPDIAAKFASSRITTLPVGLNAEDVPENIVALAEVFNDLSRRRLADMHMSAEVYDRFKTATELVRLGVATSIPEAIAMSSNPHRRDVAELKTNDPVFVDTVDTFIEDQDIDKYVDNTRNGMLRAANMLIRYWADPEAAVKAAKDNFQRDNVVIDGFPFQINGLVGEAAGEGDKIDPNRIPGMWAGLKEFIADKRPEVVENHADGAASLVMYRDPFNGMVVIHADDALGGRGMALTDEQFIALVNDYAAYSDDVTHFANDVRAIQDDAMRGTVGGVVLKSQRIILEGTPGVMLKSIGELLTLNTDLEVTRRMLSHVTPTPGSPTTRLPLPQMDTKDPLVMEISRYMRKREEKATQESMGAVETRVKTAKSAGVSALTRPGSQGISDAALEAVYGERAKQNKDK